MKKPLLLRKNHFPFLVIVTITLFIASVINAQVVRPYTNIYSDNIRGGHTIIGNTISAIYISGSGSSGIIDVAKMNDFSTSGTGNYTYGRTSAYGNDNSNIQLVDVDGGGGTTSLLSYGGLWRYYSLNNYNSAPPDISGLNWKADTYNDASNWTNTADNTNAFGYNETGVNQPTQTTRETYYLRRDINISNPSQYSTITLTAQYDDGAIVYVNGIEVARMNMPAGTPVYGTNPSGNKEYDDGDFVLNIPTANFSNGNNQIAVELYQGTSSTVDFYFKMKLDGTIVNETANSSSANLSLPAGSNTIKFARLYWGGRIDGGTGGANNINLRTAKIKFDGESYQTIIAASGAIDKSVISGSDSAYQAYFDVTTYVNTRKNGTYTMADIKAATGSISGGGYFAGWALVVVYENPSLPYTSVRVYDGFLQVYDDGTATSQTITLNGLNPPANFSLSSDAYMSTVAWEGDANLAASNNNPNGDYIKVNGTSVSNAVNPIKNFWNGTISRNGAHLTGNKNPDFKNQMSIDIDETEVGTGFGITPSTTNIEVIFGTEDDQYFPSIFAFTMKTKPPLVQLDKNVKDTASGNSPWQIPNDLLNPNEILTYTITGKNLGSGNALNCVITDTLPGNLTYRVGSLKVNSPTPGVTAGFKTDASGDDAALKGTSGGKNYIKFFIGTGATSTSGGTLAPNDSFSVQFQCIVPSNVNTLNFVSNTARITGTEQDGITAFVDDGTIVIGPEGSGLPVKFKSFTAHRAANPNLVSLNWQTSEEENNAWFEVQRSVGTDGFETVGFVPTHAVGGNSNTELDYTYTDYNDYAYLTTYRIKQVDIDRRSAYSGIKAVKGIGQPSDIIIYPNPSSNGEIRIVFDNMNLHCVSIIDLNGRVIRKWNEHADNNLSVSNLVPGFYILKFEDHSTGKITTHKFIIRK